jgi:Domain of unknown function (DUF1905)
MSFDFPDYYELSGPVWLWNFEKGSWHFFTIEKAIADEIHFAQKLKQMGQRRGFGSIKVRVTIGDSIFQTSIFPNSKDETYVLPLNAKVRKAQNIDSQSIINLKLEFI